jgi:AcrR family transcriptional regulator
MSSPPGPSGTAARGRSAPSRARGDRVSLTRERVLRAAVELADEEGIDALTMRRLGRRLGVEAMSLYNHVADKDDLLDGMAELIAAELEVPTGLPDWKSSIRNSACAAHAVMLRHPWASRVVESRTRSGPARLRLVDATVGVLAGAGFPMSTVIQSITALDSHTYGYTLQEDAWPFPAETAQERAAAFSETLPREEYPNMTALVDHVVGLEAGPLVEFEFGLDLLLDGLERMLPVR